MQFEEGKLPKRFLVRLKPLTNLEEFVISNGSLIFRGALTGPADKATLYFDASGNAGADAKTATATMTLVRTKTAIEIELQTTAPAKDWKIAWIDFFRK